MPTENNSPTEDATLLRKQIGTARTLLLIVAVATLISAILLTPNLPDRITLMNIVIISTIAVIYFLLAIYTRKKPYTAILAGLLLLLVTILLDVFLNPFGPFSRWQSKLLTILLLLLGLADSRDAQRKMKTPPAPPPPSPRP
ncbi:MAG TPA: hypothetical protein VFE32_10360 [Puia sp.]|jgi:MFS-type transporter involved in bile tolerance (Atg22 family)|nr:hypothetical protein [Puia sp.]